MTEPPRLRNIRNRSPPAMAAAAQESKAEDAPDELRTPFVQRDALRFLDSDKPCEDFSLRGAHRLKIMRHPSVPTIRVFRVTEARNRWTHGTGTGLSTACDKGGQYYDKHTLNDGPPGCQFRGDRAAFDHLKLVWKLFAGRAPASALTTESPDASVIDDHHGSQGPNGTGTGLAIARDDRGRVLWLSPFRSGRAAFISRWTDGAGTGLSTACDKGGPYYDKHTLSDGPPRWRFRSDRAADNLEHVAGLAAASAFTERVKGAPLWLAGFTHSPTARVIEAANPGGAKVVLVLDSGASMHAVGEARIMQGIRPYYFDKQATLPDGSKVRIIGIGTIVMNGHRIPNVEVVEGLKMNLISVSQLDRDHGMCCCFHGGKCYVMLRDGTVVGGAILEDDGLYKGLYVLRFLKV